MKFLELKVPPPIVMLLCMALMWWISSQWPDSLLAFEQHELLALVLVGLGFSIDMASLWGFLRARTTINPLSPHKTTDLVSGGIYRFTRNPMYVSLAVFIVAWAVWRGSALALLVLPVYVLYITRFQIKPEERVLSQQFGAVYREYCQRVRRWI